MIEYATANSALLPLWKLFPRSPADDGYQDLIIRALLESANSEDHARRIVKRLTQVLHYRPLPADIHEAANQLAQQQQVRDWKAETQCKHCDDTGWMPNGPNRVKRCTHIESALDKQEAATRR